MRREPPGPEPPAAPWERRRRARAGARVRGGRGGGWGGAAVAGAPVVPRGVLLQAEHPLAARGELVGGGAPHPAEADQDHVVHQIRFLPLLVDPTTLNVAWTILMSLRSGRPREERGADDAEG